MTPPFLPALAGLRGLAALGVLLTHVAFQTGADSTPIIGRLLGRFDMSVAVFFALSGFLLWRSIPGQRTWSYLRHRAARILPAYWVVVGVVLLLVPSAGDGVRVWASNLALTQVFVPLTLTNGLTQMWSLSVEVAFYLLLPIWALAMRPIVGPRRRAVVIAILAVLSLGWAFIPINTPDAIHSTNWLPGYLPWFAAGMVLAECVAAPPEWTLRWAAHPRLMLAIAATAFAVSATDLAGPRGLNDLEPWQYAVKISLGAVIGWCLLLPLVLGRSAHRWLDSRVAQTVGRWSYGIFLWHLAVLAIVFPVFGILPFGGHFAFVLALTVALTLPIAAASYALVEEPARLAARRRDGTAANPTATTAINAGN